LGVAFLDEALELRQAGISAPILVLGHTPAAGMEQAWKYDITLNVFNEDGLEAAMKAGTKERPLKIHVKVDTGMGRLGANAERDAIPFIEKALAVPTVMVEGVFTHYAKADETDKAYTYEQHSRFKRVVDHFSSKGVTIPLIHAGNSATGIEFPELSYNLVRLGVSMYGLYPSDEVDQSQVDLHPVMSIKTAITMVKTLPEGAGVSYGTIYHTRDNERIGTLPVGYADGFSRMLTGKAEVLVRGTRVPVVGRICMDQCMISIDGLDDVAAGEEAVLIGRQGEAVISAEELAQALGTINYEITCMIAHRVPRVYVQDGVQVSVSNPLWHSEE
jgi:alanine racemase